MLFDVAGDVRLLLVAQEVVGEMHGREVDLLEEAEERRGAQRLLLEQSQVGPPQGSTRIGTHVMPRIRV